MLTEDETAPIKLANVTAMTIVHILTTIKFGMTCQLNVTMRMFWGLLKIKILNNNQDMLILFF